jgi:integrase
MVRLTDTALRAELKKPRSRRVDLADGSVPGLFARVGLAGAATWALVLRVPGEGGVSRRGSKLKGRRYRITLGQYPIMGLADARAKASEWLARAKSGESPAKALEAVATARGITIEALARRFLDGYVRSRQLRSGRKYEQTIAKHLLPNIGKVLADVLSRDQVRELMQSVRVRQPRPDNPLGRVLGGNEAARTVLAVLRQMLSWAIRERLIRRTDNPASDMDRNLPKKRKRDRVLSPDEARIVWHAAASAGYAFGTHAQLMLLTGCRAGEWARAVWSWVDLKQGLLVIPAEAYKTDHVHVVPLVPQAVRILKQLPRGESGPYVLSSTYGNKPIRGIGKFYQTRLPREVMALTGSTIEPPFTSHDLRRTVATRLGESLGIGGEQMIRRVLGHSDGSVTAIYNRYGYVREMRACLETWSQALTASSARGLTNQLRRVR